LEPNLAIIQTVPSYPSHHPFYLHLLSSLNLEEEQSTAIISSIQQGTLVACCDGSFDPMTRKAAFGLVLADSVAKVHLLKLYGPSTGHSNVRSAIRSELSGISASIYLLLFILSKSSVKGGSITLYNDCAKALKYIHNPGRKFKRFLMDDYDLLNEIRTTIHALRQLATVNLLWVKGHYSGKNREPQHDLNEEAHSLAITALSLVSQSPIDISPPSSLADIHLEYTLTSNWQNTIRELVHSEPLRRSICKESGWSEDQFHMVDWAALHHSLRKVSRLTLLSYCKLLHGLLNTNEQNKKYYGKQSTCPHCGTGPESFLHVVSCSHPDVVKYRIQKQTLLWKTLVTLKTPTFILEDIKRGLCIGVPTPPSASLPEYQAQDETNPIRMGQLFTR
jgi:hypothetical protein